jgi:transposase
MYLQRNKVKLANGKEYTSVVLCEKYRIKGDKNPKTRALLNLTQLPEEVINSIENTLKSKKESVVKLDDIQVEECVDFGYFFVITHLMKELKINDILEKILPQEIVPIVKIMIVGMLISTNSKLGISNWLQREKYIAKIFDVENKNLTEKEFYNALTELNLRKMKLEKKWFSHHNFASNSIYLYDITSSYFEGVQNELAAYGYNRDGKKGKMQLCVGLVTDDNGFPLKIDVFKGNTVDSETVEKQIASLRQDFGINDIIFVGDRGMRIRYHLENNEDMQEQNIKFITGLTHAEINNLIGEKKITLSLFDQELAEVYDENYRYILSVNPDLEFRQKLYLNNKKVRVEKLLNEVYNSWKNRKFKNMENRLKMIENKTTNKKLKTEFSEKDLDQFKKRINIILSDNGFAKYFSIEIIDNDKFKIDFNNTKFEHDLKLCGKYVLCTNVEKEKLTKEEVRGEYKRLQGVEHGFRDLKSDLISIRPIHHRSEATTIGHVQVCFFAYSIVKSMEDKLFPFLTDYNIKHNVKLSFDDLIAELQNIKLCKLRIAKKSGILKFPKLNELQSELFQLFKLNANDMITVEI